MPATEGQPSWKLIEDRLTMIVRTAKLSERHHILAGIGCAENRRVDQRQSLLHLNARQCSEVVKVAVLVASSYLSRILLIDSLLIAAMTSFSYEYCSFCCCAFCRRGWTIPTWTLGYRSDITCSVAPTTSQVPYSISRSHPPCLAEPISSKRLFRYSTRLST